MIELKNVSKLYGSKKALSGISLTINDGDSVALLGPNGAGKSTLIKLLLGFISPTEGVVSLNGSSNNPKGRHEIGYLSEKHVIPPYLTPVEYLGRTLEFLGLSKERNEDEKRILEILKTVGMEEEKDSKSKTFSKGMMQRVALAGAIIGNPKILILDEPVSGLDPLGIFDFRKILTDLKNRGTTILLSSHGLSEVEKICFKTIIINKGKILAFDEIKNIINDGETLEDVFFRYITGDQ